MDRNELTDILNKIGSVTVCVVGDVCLDAYWHADMRLSRLSNETPHFPYPVRKETYSLGGGGNVLANLAALKVGAVLPVTVLGSDWRGAITKNLLSELGLDLSGVVTDETRVTPCYCKPMLHGISDVVYEAPRLDFENSSFPDEPAERRILSALYSASERADVVAVCDQTSFGAVSPAVIEALADIGRTKPVVADSHDHISLFRRVIVKPNEGEAAAALPGFSGSPEDVAKALSARSGAPAVVTLGERGAVWCENGVAVRVPAVKTAPPVDIVGAGDTFLSAFAAAYASGVPGETALAFANLASSVTIKKIGTTGTASPNEILRAFDRSFGEGEQ